MALLRATSPLAHQRRDLRLRRQHDVRGHLLLDPAASQDPHGLGPLVPDQLLGLAGHHRRRRDHPSSGSHPRQGVRGAHLADRRCHRGRMGGVRDQLLLDARHSQREEPLCRALVLHRHHRDHPRAPYREQPAASDELAAQLSGVRRGSGCPGAVVVWSQRGRLLPHHAHPGHHVLLHSQSGGATGLFLPALHRALLVPHLSVHLGRSASSAQHLASGLGPEPGHGVQPHAPRPIVGRDAERLAYPARRLGQTAHRSRHSLLHRGGHVLRYVDLRGAPALDQERERARAFHGLDHRPRARGRARLERVHGRGHVLLARPTALEHEALFGADGGSPLLDRHLRHPSLHRRHVGERDQPGALLEGTGSGRVPQVSGFRGRALVLALSVVDASGRGPALPGRFRDHGHKPGPHACGGAKRWMAKPT